MRFVTHMHWLSFIYPQTVLRTSSRFNPDIRVNEESGEYKLLVNGSRQSGKYIADLWQYAMMQFPFTLSLPITRILVLGVAGGTVIHMLHNIFPQAQITGVDIDPVMIEIGKKYFKLADVPKLKLIVADAQEYVRKNNRQYDLVILDLFIGREIPGFASSEIFLQNVKRILKPDGRLFINFLREEEYEHKAKKLSSVLKKIFIDVRSVDRYNNRFFMVKLSNV